MHQWVILGLTIAAFVAVIVFVLYRQFTTNYPEGKRFKKTWGSYRLNLIVHKDAVIAEPQRLLTASMNALKALVTAHKTADMRGIDVEGSVAPTDSYFKECNVYMVPHSMLPANAAAFITKKDDVPTAYIGDGYEEEILETGEPVIHEACHVVLNDYVGDEYDHSHPTIWQAAGGTNTLQHAAREIYKQLRG